MPKRLQLTRQRPHWQLLQLRGARMATWLLLKVQSSITIIAQNFDAGCCLAYIIVQVLVRSTTLTPQTESAKLNLPIIRVLEVECAVNRMCRWLSPFEDYQR